MGGFLNLILAATEKSFAEEVADFMLTYFLPFVAAAAVLWAVWIGYSLAKATDEGSRHKAKQRMHHALASIFIVAIMFSMIGGMRFLNFLAPVNPGNPVTDSSDKDNGGNSGGGINFPSGGVDVWTPGPIPTFKTNSDFWVPVDFKREKGQVAYAGFVYGVNGTRAITTEEGNDIDSLVEDAQYSPGLAMSLKKGVKQKNVRVPSGGDKMTGEEKLNYVFTETITSPYGLRNVTNGSVNNYGIDIATGEGEGVGMYTVSINATTVIANDVPLSSFSGTSESSRTDGERITGNVMSSYESMYAPKAAAYAIADGTVHEVGNIETDSNTKMAYVIIKHDKPVSQMYSETYSLYGNLYAQKKVMDATSIFHYTHRPNHPKMGKYLYWPWLPISYGGFLYNGTWYVPGPETETFTPGSTAHRALAMAYFYPYCAPQMPVALVHGSGDLGIVSGIPTLKDLWFPTTILNPDGKVYQNGTFSETVKGTTIKKGEYIGMIGGGLRDPGAGITHEKAEAPMPDLNPTNERRLHLQIHVNGITPPSEVDRSTTSNPLSWFRMDTTNPENKNNPLQSMPAPLRQFENKFHYDPPSNIKTSGGGLFRWQDYFRKAINGVTSSVMSLVDVDLPKLSNTPPFNGLKTLSQNIKDSVTGVMSDVQVSVTNLGAGLFQNIDLGSLATAVDEYGNKVVDGSGKLVNDAGDLIYDSVSKIFVVPEGIKEIETAAFDGSKGIKHLVLPSTLTEIGDRAFAGMLELESVDFSKVPNLEYIGKNAFFGSGKTEFDWDTKKATYTPLTVKNFPQSVKEIRDGAFAMTNLKSLDLSKSTNLTVIGKNAFAYARCLDDIKLPASLTTIGMFAFAGTHSLLTGVNDVLNLSNDLFPNLKKIEGGAFTDSGIAGIILPENTVVIADSLLAGAKNLRRINLPGLWTDLPPVKMPSEVVLIGDYALSYTSKLNGTLDLLTDNPMPYLCAIGEGAFEGSGLNEVLLPSLGGLTAEELEEIDPQKLADFLPELTAYIKRQADYKDVFGTIISDVEILKNLSTAQVLNINGLEDLLKIDGIDNILKIDNLQQVLGVENLEELLKLAQKFENFDDLAKLVNIQGMGELLKVNDVTELFKVSNLSDLLSVRNLDRLLEIKDFDQLLDIPHMDELLKIANLDLMLDIPGFGKMINIPGIGNIFGLDTLDTGKMINVSGIRNTFELNNSDLDAKLKQMMKIQNLGQLLNMAGLSDVLNDPEITKFVGNTQGLLSTFANFFKSLDNEKANEMAVVLNNLVGVLGTDVSKISVAGIMDPLKGLFNSLGGSLGSLTPQFTEKFDIAFNDLKKLYADFNDGLGNLVKNISTALNGLFDQAKTGLTAAAQQFKETFNSLKTYFDPIKKLYDDYADKFGKIVDKVAKPIKDLYKNFTKGAGEILDEIAKPIKEMYTSFVGGAGELFVDITDSVKGLYASFQGTLGSITETIKGSLTQVKDYMSGMSDAIKNQINSAIDPLKEMASQLKNSVNGYIDQVVGPLKEVASQLGDKLMTQINKVIDPIKEMFGEMTGELTKKMEEMAGSLMGMMNFPLSDLMSCVFQAAKQGLGENAFSNMGNLVSATISQVGSGQIFTTVSKELFANNPLLTKLNLPSSVTEIGQNAFSILTDKERMSNFINELSDISGITGDVKSFVNRFLAVPMLDKAGRLIYDELNNIVMQPITNTMNVDINGFLASILGTFEGNVVDEWKDVNKIIERLKAINIEEFHANMKKAAGKFLNINWKDLGNLAKIGANAFNGAGLATEEANEYYDDTENVLRVPKGMQVSDFINALSIILPASVVEIGDQAFKGNNYITNLIITAREIKDESGTVIERRTVEKMGSEVFYDWSTVVYLAWIDGVGTEPGSWITQYYTQQVNLSHTPAYIANLVASGNWHENWAVSKWTNDVAAYVKISYGSFAW